MQSGVSANITENVARRRGWWIKDGMPGQLLLAERHQQHQAHPSECSMAWKSGNNPRPVSSVFLNMFNFISYPSSSWDWWLRPRQASWGLQLEVPVLPQTFREAGAQDRRHTQDWADVRAKIETRCLPFILATPALLKYVLYKPVNRHAPWH